MKKQPKINGHRYVVYRKHETTGEPTYSICIYKDDMWIPNIVDIMNFIGFNGIPVKDDDKWIDLDAVFQFDNETCENLDDYTIKQNWEILKVAVNTALDRINELEDTIKKLEDRVNELENHTVKVVPDIPLQPYQPYQPYTPSPVTPGYPFPWQPIITYSTPCNDINATHTCSTNNFKLSL